MLQLKMFIFTGLMFVLLFLSTLIVYAEDGVLNNSVGNSVDVFVDNNLNSVIVNGEISSEPSSTVSLGEFLLTSYCGCKKCNGKWAGEPGAYGLPLTTGRTIAVDKSVIPLGSWVEINVPGIGWQKFRAEDTGSAVIGNHIDVYIGENHAECYNSYYNGYAEVRLVQ